MKRSKGFFIITEREPADERYESDFIAEAQALEIEDKEAAARAERLILIGKEINQKISTYFKPCKEVIERAEKDEKKPIEQAIQRLQERLIIWALEQDRKKREASLGEAKEKIKKRLDKAQAVNILSTTKGEKK